MASIHFFRKIFLASGIGLVLLSACAVAPQATPAAGNGATVSPPGIADSKDFSALFNADGQAVLTWKPVAGVDSYLLEFQIGGDEYVPLASLQADQVTFTDRNVPADSTLTYRLSAITKSKTGETRLTSIVTPVETINPLKITVEFDKSPAAIDPKNLDPKNLDLSKIDPNNFDPSRFLPAALQTQAVVGPKGGVLTVTGINNVVYTLMIPADSLAFDVPFTLKPISSIPDLPLSKGLVGAVSIEPQEAVFHIPATLTIVPPKGTPVPQGSLQAGFAFNTDGQEFHLFPTVQNAQANVSPHTARLASNPLFDDPAKGELKVATGGGYGTGNGTPQDVHTIRGSNPTNAVDSTDQQVAAAQLGDDELTPLPNIPKEAVSLAKTGEKISQKLNKADDWNKFMESLDEFTTYMNSDGARFNKGLNDKTIASLLVKANSLLKKNIGDCISEDNIKAQELLDRLVNPKDDFSKTLSSQFKAKYGEKMVNDLYNGIKPCSYQVQMKSTISYDVEGSVISTSMETQKIPLNFIYVKGDIFLWGSGPMKLSASVSGSCSFPIQHYDGLTLSFQKLSPVFTNGKLTDFAVKRLYTLGWTGGGSIRTAGEVCPTMVTLSGGGDYWTGLFTVARASLNNMMMTGWKIQNGDLSKGGSLKANWQSVAASFIPMGASGSMSEDSKIELVITPNSKK